VVVTSFEDGGLENTSKREEGSNEEELSTDCH
jgi:hypothetical protein